MTQNPTNNRHIFLVDDDQEDRELFSEALSYVNKSISLTELPSAFKLIETLNNPDTPQPEIIFLDINMPKLNGLECLKKIKSTQKFKDLKVVILSTYSHADDIEEAYQNGASCYYVKPTLFDNLKNIISGALEFNSNDNCIPSKEKFLVKYLA
ncbi:response regulator [Flavobacterium wongokense]|uniref:response regulator n=1 Tax=Flavobacterium wongokense TaxID=2910674 RepID=UPI001F4447D4|nr:response regulator [Flavobacterium sp. WG47]MCF6132174.1 response regulator [Flavobacterium sp. WG47]